MVYWFTGQPSHGKTVLANMFKESHLPTAYRIDGDEMRELFTNKDYSIKGRVTNVDAAQKISHYLHTSHDFWSHNSKFWQKFVSIFKIQNIDKQLAKNI